MIGNVHLGCQEEDRGREDRGFRYFFAGAFPVSTGLRSNFPLLSTKKRHSEALSQEAGLGDVRNGDGVYGLRRAFTLAGAESLVMSLWPASDFATRQLMTSYHKNLRQGLGRSAACSSRCSRRTISCILSTGPTSSTRVNGPTWTASGARGRLPIDPWQTEQNQLLRRNATMSATSCTVRPSCAALIIKDPGIRRREATRSAGMICVTPPMLRIIRGSPSLISTP
jgi:CHAT domain-containing protein